MADAGIDELPVLTDKLPLEHDVVKFE